MAQESALLEAWKQALHAGRSASRDPAKHSALAARIAQAADALLKQRGVATRRFTLKGTSAGSAIEILPKSGGHALNRLASELQAELPGTRLIYGPGPLMGGTEAYYAARDQALGMSNRMLESGTPDEAFAHERLHASYDSERRQGRLWPLNPSAMLLQRDRLGLMLSASGGSSYSRYQSFDEVDAYLRSIEELARALPRSTRGMNRDALREVEQLLNGLHFAAEQGEGVSRQTMELARQALGALPASGSLNWRPSTELGGGLWEYGVTIDAYERVIVNSRSVIQAVPGAARLVWMLGSTTGRAPAITAQDLRRQLEQVIDLSERMIRAYQAVQQSMAWKIERADAERTDLDRVRAAVDSAKRSM